MQKITPFLWFNKEAEEAANFYTSVFPDSKVLHRARYSDEGAKAAGMPAGTVMTVVFQLQGQNFTAINGGPHFKFTEAVSFVINCDSQSEIDHYWERLSEGGDPNAQQCGWLKDKYGLSWQVVPSALGRLMSNPSTAGKVMAALLKMKKLDIQTLEEVGAVS